MSGYAATARLTPTSIHPGPALRSGERPLDPYSIDEAAAVERPDAQPPSIPLGERVHYVRESWAQMTFYLFDPQSWR